MNWKNKKILFWDRNFDIIKNFFYSKSGHQFLYKNFEIIFVLWISRKLNEVASLLFGHPLFVYLEYISRCLIIILYHLFNLTLFKNIKSIFFFLHPIPCISLILSFETIKIMIGRYFVELNIAWLDVVCVFNIQYLNS